MTDLVRQEVVCQARRVVVKIGTRPLTRADGRLNEERIAALGDELHELMSDGRQVVLVSSGAVGAGMGQLGRQERPGDLPHLQAVAAIGQSYLVQAYDRALRRHGRHAAQLLLTAHDLDDRTRYLNVRNTLTALMDLGAVPIINENDTVSVEELQTTFGDNDRLAAYVANLVRAPLLVILSDVDGLYDRDPRETGAKVIPLVSQIDERIISMARDRVTGLSKGGMASKLEAARLVTAGGENVIIADGQKPGTLRRVMAGEPVGTLFLAQGPLVTARKRWLGMTAQTRGFLVLDDGACRAVRQGGRSLLPVGVVSVGGRFDKGDVVGLRDEAGSEFARGLTNYRSAEVDRIKGLRTEQIETVLGHRPYEEIVHRDNMALRDPL